MGYDYLGTMSRAQWDRMREFLLCAGEIISQHSTKTPESEKNPSNTIFIKRLRSDLAQAKQEFLLLEKCAVKFNGFKGDTPLKKELTILDPKNFPNKFILDDDDTAYHMQSVKDPLRQMFKRKKDNLEYRIKKTFDLIDQLELKINFYLNYDVILSGPQVSEDMTSLNNGKTQLNREAVLAQTIGANVAAEAQIEANPNASKKMPIMNNLVGEVNSHFTDGLHDISLSEGEVYDPETGLIKHTKKVNNVVNNADPFEAQGDLRYFR